MRGLWFVAGAAAGVYATSKARRAAEALTVEGVHDRLTGWFAGARVLADEVRAGTVEKETQLRARLDVVPDGTDGGVRQLPSSRRAVAAPRTEQSTPHPTRKGDD